MKGVECLHAMDAISRSRRRPTWKARGRVCCCLDSRRHRVAQDSSRPTRPTVVCCLRRHFVVLVIYTSSIITMLAVRYTSRIYCLSTKRAFGTAGRVFPSKAYTDAPSSLANGTSGSPKDLTVQQKRVLDAALRVDQAGEVAANYIYMGQLAVLGRDRVCGPLIQVSSL